MDNLYIWVLVYFLLASVFFKFDKNGSFGLRKLYNLGRTEKDIVANPDKGFVYNRNIKAKLASAFVFDLILSALFWYLNALDVGIKILLGFIGTPVVFFGFWFGGKLLSIFSNGFTSTIETIDDIETGKIDPKNVILDKAEEFKDSVVSHVGDVKSSILGEGSSSTEIKIESKTIVTEKGNFISDELSDEKALNALKKFQK